MSHAPVGDINSATQHTRPAASKARETSKNDTFFWQFHDSTFKECAQSDTGEPQTAKLDQTFSVTLVLITHLSNLGGPFIGRERLLSRFPWQLSECVSRSTTLIPSHTPPAPRTDMRFYTGPQVKLISLSIPLLCG